jgi:ParB family chromosome partitioning protein
MATEKYLTYRGDIKAGVGLDGVVAFVTAHPEGLPTPVYRIDADNLTLQTDALPCGGLADKVLADRPAFNRLVEAEAVPAKQVEGVAAQVHYQPVVLPVLIAAKDIPPLAAVAKDKKAPEAARLGAIEGLGVMADEAAEKVLVEVGTAKDDDKDVRKAAWRALRRSKRARMPKAPKTGAAK